MAAEMRRMGCYEISLGDTIGYLEILFVIIVRLFQSPQALSDLIGDLNNAVRCWNTRNYCIHVRCSNERGKYLPKKLWINPCRKKLDKGHCVDDID